MFAKIDVNGPNTHPVYEHLKSEAPGRLGTTSVKWNFTKFLVDRSDKVVKRYASTDTPKKIEAAIKELLSRRRCVCSRASRPAPRVPGRAGRPRLPPRPDRARPSARRARAGSRRNRRCLP